MLHIPLLLTAITAILVTGCATNPRYQVEFGSRGGRYSEKAAVGLDQQLTQVTGNPVTLLSGDPNELSFPTLGFYAGFVERIKNLRTRITGYYDSYSPITYTFKSGSNTITDHISGNTVGVDASIGYNLWVLRPYVGWRYQQMTFKQQLEGTFLVGTNTKIPDATENQFWIGAGLGLDIPISGPLTFVGQADYYIPSRTSSGVKISHYMVHAGIRFLDFGIK